MTRSLGRRLLLAFLLLPVAGQADAGDNCCKRWLGCGYGPGYNAPVKGGGCGLVNTHNCGNANAINNWGRGCCEIQSNWRLHVWDGYRGDPADYQRSLVGAQPDFNLMPTHGVYSGYRNNGTGIGNGAPCPNCRNGGGTYSNQTVMPAAGPMPAVDSTPATDLQPDAQSSRANSSIRD